MNQVAALKKLPLNHVKLVVGQALRWKDRPTPVITVLPDDDVAASEVLEVVGKGAEPGGDKPRPYGFPGGSWAASGTWWWGFQVSPGSSEGWQAYV